MSHELPPDFGPRILHRLGELERQIGQIAPRRGENITINNIITTPSFAPLSAMAAAFPKNVRRGDRVQRGKEWYRWDGTEWIKL